MIRTVTLAALLLLFCPVAGWGEDWPTYRHDRLRTGVSGETLKLPLAPCWTFRSRQFAEAPQPIAPPHMTGLPECSEFTLPIIAAAGSVFFTSAHDGRVVCLEAATGEPRWQFVASAAVNRTPMFWEGKIYAGSDDGHVYCLAADSGKLLWKFQAAPAGRQLLAYGRMISAWPVRTDVLVDAGVAYFAAGVFPHEGTFLYALDANTGKLIWRNGTQCENGHQLSLAPGGHLYVTGKDIWVPKDFRGYSKPYYGSPTPFLRADGRFVNGFGSSVEEDPERPKIEGGVWNKTFLSLLGVVQDGVRYAGPQAWKVEGEEKQRQVLWQHPTPDRWTDVDSGIGVRIKGKPVIFRYDADLSSIIYAGDTLFHTALDLDPAKGVGSGVYARNPADGKVLWSAEIPERANQLVAAGGRLFVGTRRGTIYCFVPQGRAAQPARDEPTAAEFPGGNPHIAAAAETIIARTGVKEGYALVLDCKKGQLPLELARRTNLSVCAVFADPAAAAKAREVYCHAGLHLSRIVAWSGPAEEPLPFPSYFADLIVSEAAATGGGLPASVERFSRLQKPIRGIALFGGEQDAEGLKKWTAATQQPGWEIVDSGGRWAKRTRPRLEDAGAWTHMLGDAGNTGCSHDGVLKPPLGVAWYGRPHIEQPGGHTALVVDGILVVPQPNALEACDQYTGRRLWRIDAGSVGVSIAAGGRHVYAKVAHVLAQIDLLTGKEKASYLTAFGKDHPWQWFAVSPDGKKVFGAAAGGLFASEMESGKGNVLWTIGGPNADEKVGGLVAMDGDRIFILGGAASDNQRTEALADLREWMKTQPKPLQDELESQLKDRDVRELIAVDAGSGKILFRRGVDVSNCGGKWLRPQGFGGRRHYNPHVGMGMYAHRGVVVIASESKADKGWQMWNSGAYHARAATAVDGRTGKLLWYKFTNHRTRPVIVDDTLHAEPWAFDLRTGEKKTRPHPITGEPADWAWCRADKQCGIFSASKHFLFGRNKGFGYQDLINDEGLYTFWHSRSNCFVDHVSGGGLMIKPPQAIYCSCEWSLPFTVALGHVPDPPAAAPAFAQPGRSLPVKHLRLDFGASGDRRDQQGGLWISSNRPVNHKLLLGYDLQILTHEGGMEVRRSAHFTPSNEAHAPFVFASALVGLKRCVLPVARDEDGAGSYRVRLGLAALPGDKPGQRVFDVRLNGRTVLKDFDAAASAGGQDGAVWKEFKVDLEKDLVLDMIPRNAGSDPRRLPVINAVEIIREAMHTPGMSQPEDVWLNLAEPQKGVSLSLANLRDAAFRGRIELETPPGIHAEVTGGNAVELESGTRRELSLRVTANDKTPPGRRQIAIKLVAADGQVAARRSLSVEWLGELERLVIHGGSACVRQQRLGESWSRRVTPSRHSELLHVAAGSDESNSGDAATSYLWFHLPQQARGKTIRGARLRLRRDPAASEILLAMQTPPAASPSEPPANNRWAALKRLAGPPWPDFNQVKYPDLPKTPADGIPLQPLSERPRWIEGNVPGTLDPTDAQPNVYFAVEPSLGGSSVFWSHQATDRSLAPVLIVDYLPAAKPE